MICSLDFLKFWNYIKQDTWAKGKKREYNGTDLNVYIGIQKALELEKMTGGELMDTDS